MQAPIRHLSEERKALERLIARAVITIVTLVALVVLVPVAWDKLSPFIVCVPVAAMRQPISRFLQQKCHFRAAPAVLLPVLVVVAIACGVIYWFASFGLEQVANLIASAPTLISDTIGFIRAAFNRLIESMDTLPVETITWLQTGVEDALKWLSTNGMALVAQIASYAGKTAADDQYFFLLSCRLKIHAAFPLPSDQRINGTAAGLCRTTLCHADKAAQTFHDLILTIGHDFFRKERICQ